MPFISEKSRRSFSRRYDAPMPEYADPLDPTFGETASAGFGSVVDENLSISALFNRELYSQRTQRAESLISQGVIDRKKYQSQGGAFDYNKLYRDLRGTEHDNFILPDSQLRDRRNEMLAKRRAGRDAILEEGSGLAQFVGMGGAYMLDPINASTLPIGTIAAAHKGLTVTATVLNASKNTAALAAASELGIQPFVYAHKEDIESPYSYLDSIAAITFAAGGGAALGSVAVGIAGYFRGVKDRSNLAKLGVERTESGQININTLPLDDGKASKQLALRVMDAEEQSPTGKISDREAVEIIGRYYDPVADLPDMAARALDDVADYVEQANATKPKSPARLVDDQNAEVIQYKKSYEIARDDAKKSLEAERKKLEKSDRWVKIIKGFGGLNKKAWEAEGIDPAVWKGTTKKVKSKKDPSKLVNRTVPPEGFPPGFWRAGDDGLTPDGLMEILRERPDLGVVYERFDDVTDVGANEAMQLVESVVENPYRYVDDVVQDQIDDIDMRIDELDGLSDDQLKAFFSKNSEEVMEEDIQLIKEYEEGRRAAMEPAIKSEDYLPPEYLEAPAATLTARDRELLDAAGYADDLDEAMAQYQALAEDRRVYTVDGEEIDFDSIMKGLDEQLETSDALRRCVYGE